ncbi:MAG: dephospho-CoA kinase [Blautia sp.]|nr:dephospho-CoA kinase [Blautia sp.]
MITLGITGGVGAGKSTILDFLEERYHAFVLKADEVGHLVMEPGRECYEPVIELFGREVIKKEDQTIDRRLVSDVVFSHPDLLEKLNGIIHPAVKRYILEQIKCKKQEKCAVCVVEAALLLEENYQEFCDEVWYVYTEKEIRIRRLMESRGYSREKAESIIRSQASEEFFRTHTDFEINNSGAEEETKKQIEERLGKYETL